MKTRPDSVAATPSASGWRAWFGGLCSKPVNNPAPPPPPAPPPDCWRFQLADQLAALTPFNEQVQACIAASPLAGDSGVSGTIFLLLDELLTNVIKYGHPGDSGGHVIDVQLRLAASGFVIDIEDDGIPFDPTAAAEHPESDRNAPLEDRAVGGWGLALVRRSVDVFEYRRDQSKNRLTLRKSLVPGGGEPAPG